MALAHRNGARENKSFLTPFKGIAEIFGSHSQYIGQNLVALSQLAARPAKTVVLILSSHAFS